MKIQVFLDKRMEWRVRIVGGNGEKMEVSEAFANKSNAKRHARAIKWGIAFAKIEIIS